MMGDLEEAQEHIELARLMGDKLEYEGQNRDQMREVLEIAKMRIDMALDEMERIDNIKNGGDSDDA